MCCVGNKSDVFLRSLPSGTLGKIKNGEIVKKSLTKKLSAIVSNWMAGFVMKISKDNANELVNEFRNLLRLRMEPQKDELKKNWKWIPVIAKALGNTKFAELLVKVDAFFRDNIYVNFPMYKSDLDCSK